MRKRVEQYDLINNLAQASAGITFGQIASGDVDKVLKDLQRVLSGKDRAVSLNVTVEDEDEFLLPDRHMVVRLNAYSEPVYALLDSGAIRNVISARLVEKLNLKVTPTERRIIVANGE